MYGVFYVYPACVDRMWQIKSFRGLGYVVAFLIVAGGLVFNIGNVGGGALGFNTLLGIPTTAGYFLAGAIAVLVFSF